MTEPIIRKSTKDQVLERLTESILSGEFPPGSRLPEQKLAASLGVSSGPIREAIRELEVSGLVVGESYAGVRVTEVTQEQLLESLPVRFALESLALQLAIDNASRSQMDELELLVDTMETVSMSRDRRAQGAMNADFHRLLVDASSNHPLMRAWTSVEFYTRLYLVSDVAAVSIERDAFLHRPIVAALLERDLAGAIAALTRHNAATVNTIQAGWDEGTDGPSAGEQR